MFAEQAGVQNRWRVTQYYLRARWLNPQSGRFLSIDPSDGNPDEPISLNDYVYANSSPIDNRDPSGRMTMIGTLGGVSLATVSITILRQGAAACFGIAVASMAPGFEAVALPKPLDLCQANTMRVHLQDSVSPVPGKGTQNTTAKGLGVVYGVPGIGVTAMQVRGKMEQLYYSKPSWWPGPATGMLKSLIIDVSQQLTRIVAGGGVDGYQPSVATQQGAYGRMYYRVDVDNLRGHNLKR